VEAAKLAEVAQMMGDILERVSGTDLNTFVKSRLFEPMKMRDTGFKPPAALKSRIARTSCLLMSRSVRVSVGILNSPLVGIEFSPPSDDEEIADGWEGDAGRRCRPEGR
jgi:CubicO group peptidase (beta-lactamase class C family)